LIFPIDPEAGNFFQPSNIAGFDCDADQSQSQFKRFSQKVKRKIFCSAIFFRNLCKLRKAFAFAAAIT